MAQNNQMCLYRNRICTLSAHMIVCVVSTLSLPAKSISDKKVNIKKHKMFNLNCDTSRPDFEITATETMLRYLKWHLNSH